MEKWNWAKSNESFKKLPLIKVKNFGVLSTTVLKASSIEIFVNIVNCGGQGLGDA